jgi:hypothetical protein
MFITFLFLEGSVEHTKYTHTKITSNFFHFHAWTASYLLYHNQIFS